MFKCPPLQLAIIFPFLLFRNDIDYLSLKRNKTNKGCLSNTIPKPKFEIFDIHPDPFLAEIEKSLIKEKESLKQEIEELIAKNGFYCIFKLFHSFLDNFHTFR